MKSQIRSFDDDDCEDRDEEGLISYCSLAFWVSSNI